MSRRERYIRKANGRFAGSRKAAYAPFDVRVAPPRRVNPDVAKKQTQDLYKPASEKHEKRFALASITVTTTAATLAVVYVAAPNGGVAMVAAGIISVPVIAILSIGPITSLMEARKKSSL